MDWHGCRSRENPCRIRPRVFREPVVPIQWGRPIQRSLLASEKGDNKSFCRTKNCFGGNECCCCTEHSTDSIARHYSNSGGDDVRICSTELPDTYLASCKRKLHAVSIERKFDDYQTNRRASILWIQLYYCATRQQLLTGHAQPCAEVPATSDANPFVARRLWRRQSHDRKLRISLAGNQPRFSSHPSEQDKQCWSTAQRCNSDAVHSVEQKFFRPWGNRGLGGAPHIAPSRWWLLCVYNSSVLRFPLMLVHLLVLSFVFD